MIKVAATGGNGRKVPVDRPGRASGAPGCAATPAVPSRWANKPLISRVRHRCRVTAKQRARDRGHRIGLRLIGAIGDEVRTARSSSGTSQTDVGTAAKVSRSTVARYESGQYQGATIVGAAELLAVVGLGLSISTYPLGDPPRDRRHVALGMTVLAHVRPPLSWRTEVPLPNAGDSRSWDATLSGDRRRTGVEFVRVLADLQALARRIALKRRDGGVDFLLVVIADTRANRRILDSSPTFMPELPRLSPSQVFVALEAGHHAGDGIVLLSPLFTDPTTPSPIP
jgi:transcriptional regulator with XRE-family HTH domain